MLCQQVTTFFCILVAFANNLNSDQTFCMAWVGFLLFDALIVFLKYLFEKVNFEEKKKTTDDNQKKA